MTKSKEEQSQVDKVLDKVRTSLRTHIYNGESFITDSYNNTQAKSFLRQMIEGCKTLEEAIELFK